MYCSKCGAQNADNAVFCSACGSPMAQKEAGPVQNASFDQPENVPPMQNIPYDGAMYNQQPYGAPYQQPYAPQPKKKLSTGALIGIIAGGVALLIIIGVVLYAFLGSDSDDGYNYGGDYSYGGGNSYVSSTKDVTLYRINSIGEDGYTYRSEITEVFGSGYTTGSSDDGDDYLYYGSSKLTFHDVPVSSAICYYSGEMRGTFAFFISESNAYRLENVLDTKTTYKYSLGSSYYVYSYLDATITVSTEYTYMSIDFD